MVDRRNVAAGQHETATLTHPLLTSGIIECAGANSGIIFEIALVVAEATVKCCFRSRRSDFRSSGIHLALHHARTAHTTKTLRTQ